MTSESSDTEHQSKGSTVSDEEDYRKENEASMKEARGDFSYTVMRVEPLKIKLQKKEERSKAAKENKKQSKYSNSKAKYTAITTRKNKSKTRKEEHKTPCWEIPHKKEARKGKFPKDHPDKGSNTKHATQSDEVIKEKAWITQGCRGHLWRNSQKKN